MRIFSAVVACVLASGSVQAATLFYVSDVYQFSNYETGVIPTFTTGYVEIDESALPSGQGLAGLDIDVYLPSEGRPAYLKDAHFENQRGTQASFGEVFQMSFGDDGKPRVWNINNDDLVGWGYRTSSNGFSSSDRNSRPLSDDEGASSREVATRYLEAKGYREGSTEFDRAYDGHVWEEGFGTSSDTSGRNWFTDQVAYAAEVAARALKAMTNAPSNFYSVGQCRG